MKSFDAQKHSSLDSSTKCENSQVIVLDKKSVIFFSFPV
jgi:hypothetical protein